MFSLRSSNKHLHLRQAILEFVLHQSAGNGIALQIKLLHALVGLEHPDDALHAFLSQLVGLEVHLLYLTFAKGFHQVGDAFITEFVLG